MRRRKFLITESIRQAEHKQYGAKKRIRLDVFSRWQDGISGLASVLPYDSFNNQWRVISIAFVFLIFGLMIVGRLFFLQVIRGEEYYVRSERNRVFLKDIIPSRGVIYDRNGEVLARNAPAFSVAVLYSEIPDTDLEGVVSTVAEILGMSWSDIKEAFLYASKRPNTQTLIESNITYEQQIALKARSYELPGVFVFEDMVRQYPQGEYVSAVLGYTSSITSEELTSQSGEYSITSSTGKSGIEKQYEGYLKGSLGKEVIEIEADGKVRSASVLNPPIAGEDIHLTLDMRVQKFAHDLLVRDIEEYSATGGSIIVMNPVTGEVLALVTLPTFDNNVFTTPGFDVSAILNDTRALLLNRAIGGIYAPGSTIKMAVGAQALEEGSITTATRISGEPQVIRVGGWEFPDWTYAWGRGPHGMMDLPAAIANSSDIFFYKVGGGYPPSCGGSDNQPCEVKGLGVDGVVRGLQNFGFGETTGIDLPGELKGLVPNPTWKKATRDEDWFLGNTYHLSIGQGDLLATPIQVINQVNIIATDAKTMRPHLIGNKNVAIEKGYGVGAEKPISLESIHVAREGMVESVTEGIVFPLRYVNVSVAAKTGTAEFGTLDAKGEYDTHAWVTGYAPIENPEMSFVVMLESGGSSTNAANVSAEFVKWYFGEYLTKVE